MSGLLPIPVPSWDGLHPIVIHFPIALLLIVPLFLFLGLFRSVRMQAFQWSSLILMAAGTLGAWVAVSTGKEAGEMILERTPEMTAVLLQHMENGQRSAVFFSVLTMLYAVLIGFSLKSRPAGPPRFLVFHLLFLALYLPACLILAQTGHLGGRLVHQFGVKADQVSLSSISSSRT